MLSTCLKKSSFIRKIFPNCLTGCSFSSDPAAQSCSICLLICSPVSWCRGECVFVYLCPSLVWHPHPEEHIWSQSRGEAEERAQKMLLSASRITGLDKTGLDLGMERIREKEREGRGGGGRAVRLKNDEDVKNHHHHCDWNYTATNHELVPVTLSHPPTCKHTKLFFYSIFPSIQMSTQQGSRWPRCPACSGEVLLTHAHTHTKQHGRVFLPQRGD